MGTENAPSLRAQPLLPLRRLSNFIYCPRLFYYQWVDHLFLDNQDTVEGHSVHRRVDAPTPLHGADPTAAPQIQRSLALESEALGITGNIDIVEDSPDGVTIVEFKKGATMRSQDNKRIAKDCDKMQVLGQAMLLKANGYRVREGFIYYAAERRRVRVTLSDEEERVCLGAIAQAKQCAAGRSIPPPLACDIRCEYCSAFPICLPKESRHWQEDAGQPDTVPSVVTSREALRPPMVDNDGREVLVVQTPGAFIGLSAGRFSVKVNGETREIPQHQVRSIYIYGAVQISSHAVAACLEEDIPVAYFSAGGSFLGMTSGLSASGVVARQNQYLIGADPNRALPLAREVVYAKIHNQRVMLMRNADNVDESVNVLSELRGAVSAAKDWHSYLATRAPQRRNTFPAFRRY